LLFGLIFRDSFLLWPLLWPREAGPSSPLLPAIVRALSRIGGPKLEPTGGAYGLLDREDGRLLPDGASELNLSPSSMPLSAVETLGSALKIHKSI
jgi:hypothetical protein